MSGYRFNDDDAGKEEVPDLAQHADFHFKDADVEDAVTRARRERLEAEEAEIEARRVAGLPLVAAPEEAASESLLKLDEPWTDPAPAATVKTTAGAAGAGTTAGATGEDEEELEDYLQWSDIPPAGSAPPAPASPPAAKPTAPHLRPPDTSGERPRAASQSAARATSPTQAASGPAAAAAQGAAAQAAQQRAARPPARPAPGGSAAATAQSQSGDAPLAPAPGGAAPGPAGRPGAQTPPKPRTGPAGAAPRAAAAAPPAVVSISPESLVVKDKLDDSGFDLRGLIDKFDPIAMLVAQIAAVALVLSLSYILYGIFGGGIGNPANVKAAQIAANVGIAGKVVCLASVALAIASIMLMLDEATLGPGLAIAGGALYFGSGPVMQGLGTSRAIHVLSANVHWLGGALLVLGGLKTTIDVGRWIWDRPNRMRTRGTVGAGAKRDAKQQLIAATATMFSPCWHLPFCREVVRVKCPAFLARKRCWKFGRGCLCDQEMVTRIMSNASLEVIKSPTSMSTRKPPCTQCVIFLEHQSMKFKMLSPLTIPLTAVAGFMAWPVYDKLWASTGAKIPGLWDKLSFSATSAVSNVADNKAAPNDMDKYQLPAADVAHVAQIMLGVLLVFLLLIYVAKFLEWAILKMNW